MRQVIQYPKTGEIRIIEVPPPSLQDGGILVRTAFSALSPGTERAELRFGQHSLIRKALGRPDLVKRALKRVTKEGLTATVTDVHDRLKRPLALGYSSSGTVLKIGDKVQGIQVGDRVACAGNRYAQHAEVVYVPQNLTAHVPNIVSLEHAAFATIGSIALQGVRIGGVSLGDRVAVVGLGLVGQLTVQIAKAAGAKVLAIDLDPYRVEFASNLGADLATVRSEAEATAKTFSDGHGIDIVLLTAATSGNDPIELASEITREKGRVIVVGDVGLQVPRAEFYAKELELLFSRSYGPGRYDPLYEEEGHDYPYGYVRWTEQRNMSAFLELVAAGNLQLSSLITHKMSIAEATRAYELIKTQSKEDFLGIVLEYDVEKPSATRILHNHKQKPMTDDIRVGMVGAGEFATSVLIPILKSIPTVGLQGVVTGSGLTAALAAQKFDFHYSASGLEELLSDDSINCIVIATRHNLHAAQSVRALQAGKNVFVEKPLAINEEDLMNILRAQHKCTQQIMVGFNRRFAPLTTKMREFFSGRRRPLVATYRVNIGSLPRDHWTHDPLVGGGRIIGEACHFVDFLQFLFQATPESVYATTTQHEGEIWNLYDETVLNIVFSDGSVGNVIYVSGGDISYSKERIEVFGDGCVAVMDDFRTLELIRGGRRQKVLSRPSGDKGHRLEWHAFVAALNEGNEIPIPFNEAVAATLLTFRAVESLRTGQPKSISHQLFMASVLAEDPEGNREV